MTNSVADYVGQRAELLARLVLTRRKDVRVFPLGDESDVGLDFIAHTTTPISGLPANPYFGVQVKGTANALDDERTANRLANQFVRDVPAKAFILAPIVLMVFSMEDDRGYWGWVMEPFVERPNTPSLRRTSRVVMTQFSPESL